MGRSIDHRGEGLEEVDQEGGVHGIPGVKRNINRNPDFTDFDFKYNTNKIKELPPMLSNKIKELPPMLSKLNPPLFRRGEVDGEPIKYGGINKERVVDDADYAGTVDLRLYEGRSVYPDSSFGNDSKRFRAGRVLPKPMGMNKLDPLLSGARLDGDENTMNPGGDFDPAFRVARGAGASNAAIADVLGMEKA